MGQRKLIISKPSAACKTRQSTRGLEVRLILNLIIDTRAIVKYRVSIWQLSCESSPTYWWSTPRSFKPSEWSSSAHPTTPICQYQATLNQQEIAQAWEARPTVNLMKLFTPSISTGPSSILKIMLAPLALSARIKQQAHWAFSIRRSIIRGIPLTEQRWLIKA